MTERVFVEMSREQALIVERACELYVWLKLGQFWQITNEMFVFDHADNTEWERKTCADFLLKEAARFIYPMKREGNRFVYSAKKDDAYNRAWDVYTALRHARAWHDNPEDGKTSWAACYNDPTDKSGDGVVKCEIKGDEMMV